LDEGYYLPDAITVIEYPDGTLLLIDGNHRLQAMKY